MKPRIALLATALVACGSIAWGAKSGDGDSKKDVDSPLPNYLWYTQVFQEDFTVTATEFDAANQQITWSLKARKNVEIKGFKALFMDADDVSWGEVELQLKPSKSEFEKDEKVQAILKLPAKETLEEVSRVYVRRLPK